MRALVRGIRPPGGRRGTIFMAATIAILISWTAEPSALRAQTTSPQAQIQQLERSLQDHPDVFDWNAHNELRHLYSTKTPPNLRKAMEHADVILQYSPMDDYILHILSDWQLDKDTAIARANLLTKAQSFPDLRFLGAACLLESGDLYATDGNVSIAKSSYLKVAADTSSDMAQYRVLAQERLSGLGEPPEEAVERRGVSKYVALGDSYSSGEGAVDSSGNAAFIYPTDTAKLNECHRSMHAYPVRVKTDFGVSDNNFIFSACSGSIEADFYKHWEPGDCLPALPLTGLFTSPVSGQSATLRPSSGNGGQWTDLAQLDTIKSDVDLVTLTVGGNDIGFAQVLAKCVKVARLNENTRDCLVNAANLSNLGTILLEIGDTIMVHPAKEFPGTTWDHCDPQCVKTCPGQTITLPSLSAPGGLFQEIHKRAPKAAIRVLLYPLPFDNIPDTDNAVCNVGAGTLNGKETNALNKIGEKLNGTIRSAIDKVKAARIDIKAADPNAAFIGHRLCNTSGGVIRSRTGPYASFNSDSSWINGLILPIPDVWNPSVFSFHPTAVGQEKIAQVIEMTF